MMQIMLGILFIFWGLILMFNGFLETKYEKRFLSFNKSSELHFESGKDKMYFISPRKD
jgi:hypothetical protein